nr:MAG TPA: hypothetical protein [Microviridae sp.]
MRFQVEWKASIKWRLFFYDLLSPDYCVLE